MPRFPQQERTSQLIHDIPTLVSFHQPCTSRWHPGDLIFTGTPGTTADIQAAGMSSRSRSQGWGVPAPIQWSPRWKAGNR